MDWPTVVLVLGCAVIFAWTGERLVALAMAHDRRLRALAAGEGRGRRARGWRIPRRVFILLVVAGSFLAKEAALHTIMRFRDSPARTLSAAPPDPAVPEPAPGHSPE
jgi:hypothetical protein